VATKKLWLLKNWQKHFNFYLDKSGFTAEDIEKQRPYAILYRKEILDDGKYGVRKFDRKLTLRECNVKEGDELMCALKQRFSEK
jgi:hypothetical protein